MVREGRIEAVSLLALNEVEGKVCEVASEGGNKVLGKPGGRMEGVCKVRCWRVNPISGPR